MKKIFKNIGVVLLANLRWLASKEKFALFILLFVLFYQSVDFTVDKVRGVERQPFTINMKIMLTFGSVLPLEDGKNN